MGDREKDRTELRKEIKIAIFWRKLIGDLEYVKFNPDDVLRWHMALDMRGPEEVRDLLAERYHTQARRVPVLGLVGESPHPPAWMVREWLSTKEPKFPMWRGIFLSLGFVVLIGMLMPTMHGCQNMVSVNPLAMHPPSGGQPTVPMATQFNVTTPLAGAPIATQSYSTAPMQSTVGMAGNGTAPTVGSAQMGHTPTGIPPAASTAQTGGVVSTTPVNSGLSGAPPP